MKGKFYAALGATVLALALLPAAASANVPRIGQDNEVEVQAGDTKVSSGDAFGGDGGDATVEANGGEASNNAHVGQSNSGSGSGSGESETENTSDITQGNNEA